MATFVHERYRPVPMAAGASLRGDWNVIGGFLPVTTGTISITDASGTVVLDEMAVTDGVPVMFYMRVGDRKVGEATTGDGMALVALTGAAGTLLVG